MPIDSEKFLQKLALSLSSYDMEELAKCCLLPTIIMSDSGKSVMSTEDELVPTLKKISERYKQAGVTLFEPTLQQTIRLSETVYFSKLRWTFTNDDRSVCFGCAASYTMQKMPDGELRIIVMVIDDDEKALAKILPKEK